MYKSLIGLWVIDSSGLCLLHHNFGETTGVDETMFSGFITAILSFTQNFVNDTLERLALGTRDIYYRSFGQFAIVISAEKGLKKKEIPKIIERVGESFSLQFSEELSPDSLRSSSAFESFGSVIDQIVGREGKVSHQDHHMLSSVLRKVKAGEMTENDAINSIFDLYEVMDEKTQKFIKTSLKDVEKLFKNSKVLSEEERKRYREIIKGVSSQIKAENWLSSF